MLPTKSTNKVVSNTDRNLCLQVSIGIEELIVSFANQKRIGMSSSTRVLLLHLIWLMCFLLSESWSCCVSCSHFFSILYHFLCVLYAWLYLLLSVNIVNLLLLHLNDFFLFRLIKLHFRCLYRLWYQYVIIVLGVDSITIIMVYITRSIQFLIYSMC